MTTRAFEYLCAYGCVGPFVSHRAHFHACEMTFLVAAGPVFEFDRVALRMKSHALFTRERRLYRPLRQPRHQCDVLLHPEVFLATEGAAIADQLDVHLVVRQAEHIRDLIAIVEYALPLRINDQFSALRHCGECRG